MANNINNKLKKKARKDYRLILLALLLISFTSGFSFVWQPRASNVLSSANQITSVVESSTQDSNLGQPITNEISLVAVEVDKLPRKTEYFSTDTISTAGGVLRLSFSDYSVKYIPMNDQMVDYSRLNLSQIGATSVPLKVELNNVTKFTTYPVTVIPFVILPTKVTLDIKQSDVNFDQELVLKYSIEPSNAFFTEVTWTSSDELIASVDQNGRISPKNPGVVNIAINIDNLVSDIATLNILPRIIISQLPSVPQAPPAPSDTTPPILTSSTISVTNLTNTSLTLTWSTATDDTSLSNDLVYEIFQNSSAISNLAISNNLTPIHSANNISSYNITGLNQGTTYHFNVVVSDQAGNKTIYSNVTVTTTVPFSDFDGYYLAANLLFPITNLSYPIPSGSTSSAALSVLPSTLYEKDINGNFNQVTVVWDYKPGVTFSSVSPDTNEVITTLITGSVTVNNPLTPIEGILTTMPIGAIPISNATQLAQIKTYSTSTTVTFGQGTYETSKTFSSSVSAMALSYYLTNNIDLSTFNSGVWTPIGVSTQTSALFQGTLNGNNFKIYNFNNVANTRYVGLFGNVRGATISNLSLYGDLTIDISLQSQNSIDETGGLISNNYGNDTSSSPFTNIANVHTFVNITSNSLNPIGGLVGINSNAGRVAISNSSNSGNINLIGNTSSRTGIGGLVGKSQILNSRSTVNITRSFNTGSIKNSGLAAGGLLGEANGSNFTIVDSYNIGEIIAAAEAGGIVGNNTNTTGTMNISRSYNIGKIFRSSGTSTNFGPIVGFNFSTVVTFSNNYALNNLVDYEGNLSNGNASTVTTFYTNSQLTNQANYTGYTFSNNQWAINEGNTSAYLDKLPEIFNVSVTELEETIGSSGQITNNVFNITLTNTSNYFDSSIDGDDVSANNLPAGLNFSVTYVEFNTLRITISGSATNHESADSISNLNFTIDQSRIIGATQNYTTRNIRIKFINA